MTQPGSPTPPDLALERILSEVYLRMRQGHYAEAAQRLEKAKELAPEHPGVLEIEGDLAFTQRRYRQAEKLYKTAHELDPKNIKLEDKYATAVLKVYEPQLLAHQTPDDSLWSSRIHRRPATSMCQSMILPGLGQVYNGDWLKGLGLLLFTIIGNFSQCSSVYAALNAKTQMKGITSAELIESIDKALFSGAHMVLTLLLIAAWLYAMVDAWIIAKNTK